MRIEIKDNFGDAISEFMRKCTVSAEKCGLEAERSAKDICPWVTGNLCNSINHSVVINGDNVEAHIGTNVEYGVYVEIGTGAYIFGGSPSWSYQDDQGKWHKESGHEAKPFLKPAVADHEEKYISIIREELKK